MKWRVRSRKVRARIVRDSVVVMRMMDVWLNEKTTVLYVGGMNNRKREQKHNY